MGGSLFICRVTYSCLVYPHPAEEFQLFCWEAEGELWPWWEVGACGDACDGSQAQLAGGVPIIQTGVGGEEESCGNWAVSSGTCC